MLLNQKKIKLKICFLMFFSLFLLVFSVLVNAQEQKQEQYTCLKDIIFQASNLTNLQKEKCFAIGKKAIEMDLPKKDIEKIIKECLNMETNPEDLEELIFLLMEAKSSGVPFLPLINKIKEGFLKGIDIKSVLEVIKIKKEKLSQAQLFLLTLDKKLKFEDINKASEELVLFEERGIDWEEAQKILRIAAEKKLSFYEVREGFETCLDFQEKGLP